MRQACLVGLICLTPTLVLAGPFGIEQGVKIGSLSVDRPTTNSQFYLKVVPTPNSLFERYMVKATPGEGVCMIKAFTSNFTTDSAGYTAKNKADQIADLLKAKYGQPVKSEYMMRGSIWNEPRDFMMGNLKNERRYSYSWDNLKNEDKIKELYVGVNAIDSDTAMVRIEYYLENYDVCSKESDKASSVGL